MNPPQEVADLLRDCAGALFTCLGDSLVGVYLYGSAVWNAYDPETSDIDVIVLLRAACTPDQIDALATLHDDLARRHPLAGTLDISYVPLTLAARHSDSTLPYYRDGHFVRQGSGDVNTVTWHTLHQHGVPIVGPPASDVIPPVSPDVLRETMWYNLGFLSGRMPAYVARGIETTLFGVVSLCRVLHTLRTGEIASKRDALDWARAQVGEDWKPYLRNVRALFAGDPWASADDAMDGATAFAGHIRRLAGS
ncbi:MAG TPA: aminoglycoside adenylyltransferase domain-containing protein [Chloroflexota bacterium]|nr:aminoglycoside adenylyltransferase domain-containing protein [Chloroflexota bacterium]